MKALEKFTLIIYSVIMLIVAIILCLLVFNWLDIDIAGEVVEGVLVGPTSSKVVLG